ncbi:GTP-binding protein [Streptomyces sp. NPDC058867]|uniref:GTP-binding protein n=1 Tax=unclassified Streptomyces TaxID=2593676 RepID=UPI0036CAC063
MPEGLLSVVTGNTPAVRGATVDRLRRLNRDAPVLAVSIEDGDGRYPMVHRHLSGDGAGARHDSVQAGSGDPAVILRQDLMALRGATSVPNVILVLPGDLDLPPFLADLWRPRLGGGALGERFGQGPVVVGLDAASFLADIGCVHRTVRLWNGSERGEPLTAAEAAARQVEAADAVVVPAATGGDRRTLGVAALAGHLNAHALVWSPASDTAAVPELPRRLLCPGSAPWGGREEWLSRLEPVSAPRVRRGRHEGVESVLWRSRRPLHPQRLADALATVMFGVVRSRGHLWLSSRPDAVVAWRSAGAHLALQENGDWLSDQEPHTWAAVSAQRRTLASWFWHDYYGERRNEIVFTGVDLDAQRVRAALDEALLTDAELARGREGWVEFPDPLLRTDDAA